MAPGDAVGKAGVKGALTGDCWKPAPGRLLCACLPGWKVGLPPGTDNESGTNEGGPICLRSLVCMKVGVGGEFTDPCGMLCCCKTWPTCCCC